MKIGGLFDRQTVHSLLGYIFLLATFFVSGCASAPKAIPPGADGKVDIPLDATVTQTVQPGEQTVTFTFLKHGKRIWWERPGNTADRWRFALYGPGKEGDEATICKSDWTKELSQISHKIDVPCDFESPEQLAFYLGKHVHGVFEFRLDGESTSEYPDPDRVIDASYYILSDSKMCQKIDENFRCMNVK